MGEEFNYSASDIKYKYSYGDWVLRDVCLNIKPCELIKINGKNGSGKTTLFLALSGLLKYKSGNIVLNDSSLLNMNFSERSSYIGVAFQNPSYQLFGTSIKDELLFGIKNQGCSEQDLGIRMRAFEEHFGQFDYERNSSELSFGWKKILSIACIYAMNPRILILDEPEVGLDPLSIYKLEKLIVNYLSNGNSVVFSSHEKKFLNSVKNTSYTLNNGTLNIEE